MDTAIDLRALEALLAQLSDEDRKEVDALVAAELEKPWMPNPGPQTQALLSEADLLLYGGAAGGGKTDLLCGLALTEHEKSLIFRRQSVDLDGFWDRLAELCPAPASKDANKRKLTTTDNRRIECGHLEAPGSELSWQGRPHDFIGFDEGAQLSASKVNFVLGWLRSATGKRCRAVIASNPPMGSEGAWIFEWFGPWVDPLFENPAVPGELRWAVAVGTDAEIKTIWVDGPRPVIVDGDSWRLATQDEVDRVPRLPNLFEPLSRTFIPSFLDDNPYLAETNYRAQINSQAEPRRSQLLYGDFLAGREDDEWQIIPSEWVREAQSRWPGDPSSPMRAIGVDVAQGGSDNTVLAPLHDNNHFAKLVRKPGVETPDGAAVGALILKARRDTAAIGIDTSGGWGGAAREHLSSHHEVSSFPINFGSGGSGTDKKTQYGYLNLRAQMYWEFRNALDPESGEDVILPPDKKLAAQLTASLWRPRSGKIQVEEKDAIKARIGASPDDADAIVIAWHIRNRAVLAKTKGSKPKLPKSPRSVGAQGWMGR